MLTIIYTEPYGCESESHLALFYAYRCAVFSPGVNSTGHQSFTRLLNNHYNTDIMTDYDDQTVEYINRSVNKTYVFLAMFFTKAQSS